MGDLYGYIFKEQKYNYILKQSDLSTQYFWIDKYVLKTKEIIHNNARYKARIVGSGK